MKIKRPGRVTCRPVNQFRLTEGHANEFKVETTRTCRECDAQVLLDVGDIIEEREETTNNESGIMRRTYYAECKNCGGHIRVHERETSTGIVFKPKSLPTEAQISNLENAVVQQAA